VPLAESLDLSRRHVEQTPVRDDAADALAARADGAAKLRWSPDSARSAEASVLALDERQRWRDGTLYGFADNRQWSGRATAAWRRGAHRLAPTVSASVFDHRSRSSVAPQPIAGDTGQRQLQRVYQAELLYNGRVAGAALDVGTQVRRDETETARVPGGLRAFTAVEPFAQVELAPAPGLALVPGVRVTHSSQWGTHVTPRVALRQRVGAGLTLRASAGEGFRAPDFKELYMRFVNQGAGYAVNGNPDLRPETSRNVTAGAEWAGTRAWARGQLYWNRFTDFIETRPVGAPGAPPVYEYGNVDDGTTRGVDVEGGVALAGVRLEASYAGLATRDDATGQALLARPAHSARATVAGTLPLAVRASVTGLFTGRTPMERDAATGAVTSWRDAFVRTDLRLARTLPGADAVELIVGADNLFDRRPAQWAGYTARHVYTALSWALTRTPTR
ncbi:TonB-dependent receptor, partial [Roseisolibacter sp. H3M3-2]|uniref:TonB-dependent receptor plug domain-containing protein n=1 Tax=Roseisolibacter sp. H3M3-2 TaxID=3031323 RepID=UPI0023DB895F